MSFLTAPILAEFPPSSSPVISAPVLAIRDLAQVFSDYEQRVRDRTIGSITKEEECGPHFVVNIMPYIGALKFARRAYSSRIFKVAHAITQELSLSPQLNAQHGDKLWLSLMLAIEPLSGRPSKKHAALLVDRNNCLVAWDVARVPNGIEERAELFIQRRDVHRGAWIRCAEQNCMARALDVVAKSSGSHTVSALARVGDAYFEAIQKMALDTDVLKNLTMYARLPCTPCANLLIKPADKSLLLAGLGVIEGHVMTNGIRKPKEAYRRFTEASPAMRAVSTSDLVFS